MYIGIDFGTCFSQVSAIVKGQPFLLVPPGEYGTPSAFYYDSVSGILVGQEALNFGQGSAAANLVTDVKMNILRDEPYTLDGRTFTVQEIITEILRSVLHTAAQIAEQNAIPSVIEGAVVSIPAKFSMAERAVIRNAVRTCIGKNIPLHIIKEPVAAALCYDHTNQQTNRCILIFDLGGGTCDVALVEPDPDLPEQYTVINSDMERLGGRNWDQALVEHLTKIFQQQSNVEIVGNAGYEEKIRLAAISVKHSLSDPLRDRAVAAVEINGTPYRTIVTRQDFDEITLKLLLDAVECVKHLYYDFSVEHLIDEIICVGGSSNMLQIKEVLKQEFPGCRIQLYMPQHAVVNGNALYATSKQVKDFLSFSYGIDVNASHDSDTAMISNILKKGMPLPAEASKFYQPARDGMSTLTFSVFESENMENSYKADMSEKICVGTVVIRLPEHFPQTELIECTLRVNTDGLLEVTAKDAAGNSLTASCFQLDEF